MSFSPFEDFLEVSTDYAVSTESTTEDGLGDSSDRSSSSNEGMYETTVLSPRDPGDSLSFPDSMSIDSDALQEFGSLVTLPPGTLAGLIQQHHGQNQEHLDSEENTMSTIVSSDPSGSFIPAPEASQDIWAISPHPALASGNIDSLSTVCTETLSYQRLAGETPSVVSALEDENGSSQSSRIVSRALAQTPAHERAAFEAIANQVLQGVSEQHTNNFGEWYSRFTDFDWAQLREIAKIILATTGNSREALQLPPPSPVLPLARQFAVDYNAEDHVPTNFVCALCKDVVVGALALNCGCTVCTGCWEENGLLSRDIAEEEGYVWIDTKRCGGCRKMVHSLVPCQALDVAIFRIMEKLDPSQSDARICSMRMLYYSRLEAWRQTLLDRNEDTARKQALQEDEMLARLIQQEEDLFWGESRCRNGALSRTSRTFLVIGQVAVALCAATVSSLALKAFVRRR